MLRDKRRVGFFGGTFDPLHCGHIEMARAAALHLQLHSVIFVPTRQNPLKEEAPRVSDRQRVDMIRTGIRQFPRFDVWEGELDREGPSYTLHTIRHIEQVYPNSHLFWIIGTDQLGQLRDWYGIDELVNRVGFIVVHRPGFKMEWPGIPGLHLYPVNNPLSSISSTRIRQRIQCGKPIAGWVPAGVEAYIRQNGLYA